MAKPPSNADKPLRIHQSVARKLGTAILRGDYAPGDQIGVEIEQSEALRVSRTAYREAIRLLIGKGLLESRPKVGTHVTPRKRWNLLDPDVLAWSFSDRPDESFFRELFELRSVLEPAAARFAAQRRSEAQVHAMREALDTMRNQGLASTQGRAADQRFHHLILEATGNRAIASLGSSIGAAVRWTTFYKQQATALPRDAQDDHEAVFSAIADGDPSRAQSAMKNLLELALFDMHVAVGETVDQRGGLVPPTRRAQ